MRATLVLLMAVENAGTIAAALVGGGRAPDTPAVIICDGSLPTERKVTPTLGRLGSDVLGRNIKPPAVIVIGDVAHLAG
jgi:uroporphyrin-III C-methyltransferase/precorrin-2 dehydrogenase/sirohydrochlorin ferrochelatase